VARILQLDAARLDMAVGLAAAQASGIQESFGSMAKPFQVGRAAADALLSGLAAEAGMTGPRSILDAPGWARRLSPDRTPARLTEELGHRWAVTELMFKRYPCCFGTHAAIRALLALRLPPAASAIERVELTVGPTTLQVANQREPRTGLAGKFSMGYCAAAALARGHVREDDFADAAVREPAVQALATRVHLTADPALDETRARAVVHLAGGERREHAVDLGADEDLEGTRRALAEKFRALVAPRLGEAEAGRLAAAIGALDEVDDVRGLQRSQ
jgi:2-methylcitrate dehydratase PrpD